MPAFSHEVYDVTGAGDTVVSVLLLSLVSGANLKEAVGLANTAASIIVEKIGTSQVTIEEIHKRIFSILQKAPFPLNPVKTRLLFEIRQITLYNKVLKVYKIMVDEFEMEEIRNNIGLKEKIRAGSRDAANREGRSVDQL